MFLTACGGSGLGPSGPTPIATPQVTTHPVTFVAFLDENANGVYETNEGTRIPGAELVVGAVKGTTAAKTGEATLQIPAGSATLTVTAASLPPFYRPPANITVSVPATAQVLVPITLPRGSNRANVYMAFGDSITNGEPGVGDGNGYRRMLEATLGGHFGTAEVANRGRDATYSTDGADLISRDLSNIQPAFVLVYYGTNDWNDLSCRQLPCFTTVALRSIVRQINQRGSHAFLASLLPINTDYDNRAPASRNEWVVAQNTLIKQVAEEEGAVYVDTHDAFMKSGRALPALFVDHIHPTAVGYEIMSQTWFSAITKAYSKILSTS